MEYRTKDSSLAAYLQTTKRLKFLRLEPVSQQVNIVFDDPHNAGPQIEIEFMSGAECPASEYSSRLKALRRSIQLAQQTAAQALRCSQGVNRG